MGQASRFRIRKVQGKGRRTHVGNWEVTRNGAHLSGHKTKKLAELKATKLRKGRR